MKKHQSMKGIVYTTSLALAFASVGTLATGNTNIAMAAPKHVTAREAASSDSITIKSINNIPLKGQTFDAYQMMTANYISDKEEQYVILDQWKPFFTTEYNKFMSKKLDSGKICTSEEASALLQQLNKNPKDFKTFKEDAAAFAKKNSIKPTQTATGTDNDSVKISGLPNGYYMVTQENKANTESISRDIFVTVDSHNPNATVNLKADVPNLSKTIVKDNQDKKATTAGIGDDIEFKLVSKVPDTQGYDTYNLSIGDTMCKGLTLKENSFDVKIGGVEFKDYKVEKTTDGFKLVFASSHKDNIVGETGMNSQQPIVVTYKATLNSAATLGQQANENKAHITYSSNPYDETQHKNTPDSKADVYSFGLDITKQNTQNTVLPGAEFTLKTATGADINVKVDENRGSGHYIVTKDNDGTATVTTDKNGKIIIDGLAAGSYQLVETKAPKGYNLLTAPIKFDITPTLTQPEYGTDKQVIQMPVLKDLTTNNKDVTADVKSGYVKTTVINKTGGLLPQTGGRGIMMIVVAGLALMGIATYLLFFRKKTEQE